jgi:outer membrane receptor for ferrienterochelin and colicin
MRNLLLSILILSMGAPAVAQEQAAGTSSIAGTVVDVQNGLPVAQAKVVLYLGETRVADSTSDASGSFRFTSLPAGTYSVEFSAIGYDGGRSEAVQTVADATTTMRTVLSRSKSAGGLTEIAAVASKRGALQTSSVISQHISAETMQREGLLRVGDALLALPGVSAFDLDSAPGDDLHVSIRGNKASETAALLDGLPIGPIGVGSDFRGGYNYQLSPAWALNTIDVTYGTGGLALYGTDTIAGTVDFQTLSPTRVPNATYSQGFGTQGRLTNTLTATGTAGRWGYAFATGTQGTWGGFKPGTFTQNALLSAPANVSPANVAANTWPVDGDYLLRATLVKARYSIAPTTSITLTGYSATSWDNKTGQGDNDAYSPAFAGGLFDQSAGSTPGCGGVSVMVDNSGGTQCYDRSQYVNAFSGPYGGTPVAWQALRNQHYSVRLNAERGANNFAATAFIDTFNVIYNRDDAGTTNNYRTFGEQLSDDIVTEKNDLGFGVYGYAQSETDGTFQPGSIGTLPTINASAMNYFLRDTWTPSSKLTTFASAWFKTNAVTNTSSFDPRLTVMFRPTSRDVVRVSSGVAQGVPQIGLLLSPVQFNLTPASINPNPDPNGLTSVATSANPLLRPEQATDVEFSYGHQFHDDTNVQLIAYDMNERNALFSAVIPLSSIGLTAPPALLPQYLARIGPNATTANLGVTTVANAGTARYRGFDITGRVRANRSLYLDYSYDALSARLFDIPVLDQMHNLVLIDGGQIDKVPVHQASIGLDYSTPGGFETRFDGYYVGNNNGLLRPAYTYANAAITQRVKTLTFNLGIYNVFNSQYDQFGRIGLATFQPENRFGTDATGLQEALSGVDGERFGLPQRSLMFTISTQI